MTKTQVNEFTPDWKLNVKVKSKVAIQYDDMMNRMVYQKN